MLDHIMGRVAEEASLIPTDIYNAYNDCSSMLMGTY